MIIFGRPECGGCHQWGINPVFDGDRWCGTCKRTWQEIADYHGSAFFSNRYLLYMAYRNMPAVDQKGFRYRTVKEMRSGEPPPEDHYKKEIDTYFSEPCDTCTHRFEDLNKGPCRRCTHYAR